MPKNYKTGTPHRKNRNCPLCDARPRSGKAWKFHLAQVHPESLAPGFWREFWFGRKETT